MEGGQDKGLPVSGKLPEARCRFVPPRTPGTSSAAATATNPAMGDKGSAAVGATAAAGGGGVVDFGRASVGVEVLRTVMLQNIGKSPAVFFIDAADLKQVSFGQSRRARGIGREGAR